MIFGAATAEGKADQLPSQLVSSLAQFRGKLEVYDRLATQALERTKK